MNSGKPFAIARCIISLIYSKDVHMVPKMSSRCQIMCLNVFPRFPQDIPKIFLRWPQYTPKMSPNIPIMTQRCQQNVPKSASKMSPRCPRYPKVFLNSISKSNILLKAFSPKYIDVYFTPTRISSFYQGKEIWQPKNTEK